MFCKNCGNELNDKAIICPKCGCAVNENSFKKPTSTDTNTGLKISSLIGVLFLSLSIAFYLGAIMLSEVYGGYSGGYLEPNIDLLILGFVFAMASFGTAVGCFVLGFRKENKENRLFTYSFFIINTCLLIFSIIVAIMAFS